MSFKKDARWVSDLGLALYFKGDLAGMPSFNSALLRMTAQGHPWATCGGSIPIEFNEISVSGSQNLAPSEEDTTTIAVVTNTPQVDIATECPGGWVLSDVSFSQFTLVVESLTGQELIRLGCTLPSSANGLVPNNALDCIQVPPPKSEL